MELKLHLLLFYCWFGEDGDLTLHQNQHSSGSQRISVLLIY